MLKSMDFFGKPIMFTFRGQETYQTWFGATVSLLSLLIILVFISMRQLKLFSKDDPFFAMTT